MDVSLVKERLGNDWVSVLSSIADALQSAITLLNDTNNRILLHSGKQLRPLLALLMARACKPGEPLGESTIRYAAASELLHNATLLHDDVADESDCRRGVPTINSLMGPSVSVLVGDYWLVKAMDLILGNAGTDIRAIRIFSKTLSDLAKGEMLQLQKSMKSDTTESDYLSIIYCKTASLFEAACLSAVISVNASEEYEKAAVRYATSIGLAFQIKDDLLDYVGGDSVGKPLGADLDEQKITAPLLGAFENVGKDEQDRIRNMIGNIHSRPEYKQEIVDFVINNGGISKASAKLDLYVEEAVKALDVFPSSFEKDCLVELAHFVAVRKN